MAKKRKKGSHNRHNAAGNSRVSVLTEDGDTYNPFKDIKRENVTAKIKSTTKNVKPKSYTQKEKIVEELDKGVSFAEIFEQWEKGGIVESKKGKTIVKTEEEKEDFAKIFEEWEISQGIRPKHSKKAKVNENRKVSKYKPTKDFGQLLEQFEKGPLENKSSVKTVKIKSVNVSNNKISNDLVVKDNAVLVEKDDVSKKTESNPPLKKEDKNVAWSANKGLTNISKKEVIKEKPLSHKKEDNEIKKSSNSFSNNRNDVAPPSKSKKHKWDFSDIYGIWETKHNEEEALKKAKQLKEKKEKKECKGISISYLRSMKPEAELDLHGLTSDIAALKVSEFLVSSRNKGLKKVSIITGKGLHSENGKAILRDIALEEIRFSNIVREAYHPKAVDGGSGVIWVIFKSTTDKKIYY